MPGPVPESVAEAAIAAVLAKGPMNELGGVEASDQLAPWASDARRSRGRRIDESDDVPTERFRS